MQISKPKLSKKRLIVSGDILELYEYDLPYMYNSVGRTVSGGAKASARRADNLSYVRTEIRRIVECNYKLFGYQPIFLTFTYERNETYLGRAWGDFTRFIERLNYTYNKKHRYLSVVEFQERGAVHFHCIFFNMALDVESRERCGSDCCMAFRTGACMHGDFRRVAIIWGHGFVDIEAVRSAKAVGPYVSSYLDKTASDSRLVGQKAYATSRGLIHPREYRSEIDIDRIMGRCKLKETHTTAYESSHYKAVTYTQYVKDSSHRAE